MAFTKTPEEPLWLQLRDARDSRDVVRRAGISRTVKERILRISRNMIFGAAVAVGVTEVVGVPAYVGYEFGRATGADEEWKENREAEEKRLAEMQAWQAENPEIVKELWSLGIPELKEREGEVDKTAEDNQSLAATLRAIRVAKERISGETTPAGSR